MAKKTLYIKTNNTNDRSTLLGVLYSLGAIFHRGSDDLNLKEATEQYTNYPVVVVRPNGGSPTIEGNHSGYGDEEFDWSEDPKSVLKELNDWFDLATTTIAISKDYDAIISKDGIRVGCQHITIAKFAELTAALKKHTDK